MLIERMFLLNPGDIDPKTGLVYTGQPIRSRFLVNKDSTLRNYGYHEFDSVARYKNSNFEEVAADFVIDLDHPSANDLTHTLDVVYNYCSKPWVYSSGSKGIHIVIPWTRLGLPEGDWKSKFALFVMLHDIPADLSIYRTRSMVRIAGSLHAKTGRQKRLIHPEDATNLDAPAQVYPVGDASKLRDWLLKEHHVPQSLLPTLSHTHINTTDVYVKLRDLGTPDCIETLYNDGIPAKGLRNTTYHTLASYYRSTGKDYADASQLMTDFATLHSGNTEASTDQRIAEAGKTLSAVYRGGHKFSCKRVRQELDICNPKCPLRT